MTYTGEMDAWKFAIYKYSNERYATHEIFPGMGEMDGTIEGDMRVVWKLIRYKKRARPVRSRSETGFAVSEICSNFPPSNQTLR